MNLQVKLELMEFLTISSEITMETRYYTYIKMMFSTQYTGLYLADSNSLDSNLVLLGIFNTKKDEFVLLTDDGILHASQIFEPGYQEARLNELSLSTLNKKVNDAVLTEIDSSYINIYEEKADLSYQADIYQKAKEFFLKKQYPDDMFSIDINLTYHDIVACLNDFDTFSYEKAEHYIETEQNKLSEYQKQREIMQMYDEFEKQLPFAIELEKKLRKIQVEEYNPDDVLVELNRNGKIEEVSCYHFKDVFRYPLYAIQKIYKKKKVYFDIKEYEEEKVAKLRTDFFYHMDFLHMVHDSFRRTNNVRGLECIDAKMFANEVFAEQLLDYHFSYEWIADELKGSLDFIQKAIGTYNVLISNVLKYTKESEILKNKPYFLKLIQQNHYFYSDLPSAVQVDPEFFLTGLRKNSSEILTHLTKELYQIPEIKEEVRNYLLSNNINYRSEQFPAALYGELTDDAELINAIDIKQFNKLPERKLNDKNFIIAFFQQKLKRYVGVDFEMFYQALKDLKTDYDVIFELFKASAVYTNPFELLPEEFSTNIELQRQICNINIKCINFVCKELQKELIALNPHNIKYILSDNTIVYTYDLSESRWDYGRKNPYGCKDIELVRLAVAKDVSCLDYVNDSIVSDKALMLEFIKQDASAFQFLNPEKMIDFELASEASTKCCIMNWLIGAYCSIRYSSLLSNMTINENCFKQNPESAADLVKFLLHNLNDKDLTSLCTRELVLLALQYYPNTILVARRKAEYMEDEEIAMLCIKKDIELAKHFPVKLFKRESFMMDLLKELELQGYSKEDIQEYVGSRMTKKLRKTEFFLTNYPYLI